MPVMTRVTGPFGEADELPHDRGDGGTASRDVSDSAGYTGDARLTAPEIAAAMGIVSERLGQNFQRHIAASILQRQRRLFRHRNKGLSLRPKRVDHLFGIVYIHLAEETLGACVADLHNSANSPSDSVRRV
jgi:hypothetical protein